jgi:hypothetical protein
VHRHLGLILYILNLGGESNVFWVSPVAYLIVSALIAFTILLCQDY